MKTWLTLLLTTLFDQQSSLFIVSDLFEWSDLWSRSLNLKQSFRGWWSRSVNWSWSLIFWKDQWSLTALIAACIGRVLHRQNSWKFALKYQRRCEGAVAWSRLLKFPREKWARFWGVTMRLGYFSNPSDKAPGDCFHQFSSSSSRPLDFNNPPLRKNWVTSDEISARFQFFGMPLFLLCDQYCCKQVIHTTCTGRRFRIELRKWNLSELFCMMFERWLSNFTKTSQKLHSE